VRDQNKIEWNPKKQKEDAYTIKTYNEDIYSMKQTSRESRIDKEFFPEVEIKPM
jgi:hypothetical protein